MKNEINTDTLLYIIINVFCSRCVQKAQSKGYSVIGLQYYGECWGGTHAHETFDKYGASKDCVSDAFKPVAKDVTGCKNFNVGKAITNFVYRVAVTGL